MNNQKIVVLLFMLIVYVNYVMHFKKDVHKLEKSIVNIKQRIAKEEQLFKNKEKYKDINSTKDYSYLFYNGKEYSYSETMSKFQQDIESVAKKKKCTVTNTRWQDMPKIKDRTYDLMSLNLTLYCTPQKFIEFQNQIRQLQKLLIFNQIDIFKEQRKNLLRIRTRVVAYRSKNDK